MDFKEYYNKQIQFYTNNLKKNILLYNNRGQVLTEINLSFKKLSHGFEQATEEFISASVPNKLSSDNAEFQSQGGIMGQDADALSHQANLGENSHDLDLNDLDVNGGDNASNVPSPEAPVKALNQLKVDGLSSVEVRMIKSEKDRKRTHLLMLKKSEVLRSSFEAKKKNLTVLESTSKIWCDQPPINGWLKHQPPGPPERAPGPDERVLPHPAQKPETEGR